MLSFWYLSPGWTIFKAMDKIQKILVGLLPVLVLGIVVLFASCGEDIEEEPAIYTPQQIRRLLYADSTKLWQQGTEHYLEDSCRTGFYLRFRVSEAGTSPKPFEAYFYRDTTVCEAGENPAILQQVITPKSPAFKTTDSLVFINARGDSTLRLIKALTSQRLVLELIRDQAVVHREEYRFVEP